MSGADTARALRRYRVGNPPRSRRRSSGGSSLLRSEPRLGATVAKPHALCRTGVRADTSCPRYGPAEAFRARHHRGASAFLTNDSTIAILLPASRWLPHDNSSSVHARGADDAMARVDDDRRWATQSHIDPGRLTSHGTRYTSPFARGSTSRHCERPTRFLPYERRLRALRETTSDSCISASRWITSIFSSKPKPAPPSCAAYRGSPFASRVQSIAPPVATAASGLVGIMLAH